MRFVNEQASRQGIRIFVLLAIRRNMGNHINAVKTTIEIADDLPRIHDARIAALYLHHGVTELWSADRDFSFFPQLRVRNPLVAAG